MIQSRIKLLHSYVNNTSYPSTILEKIIIYKQEEKMVKVKDFHGAVFHPEDYQTLLNNNIQHLQQIPMSKTFNTPEMLANGRLRQEKQPFFYIYRQVYLGHTSYGILAQISLEDYHNNNIRKHEKTLIRPGMNHESYIQQHVGPVVVSYRENNCIRSMINSLTSNNAPYSQWNTKDGRQHTLWRIKEAQASLSDNFEQVDFLYILDGHHRFEAAHQNYLLSKNQKSTDLWIQALIYSSDDVMVHPQHRVVQDTSENLEIINKHFELQHLDIIELDSECLKQTTVNQYLQVFEVLLKLDLRIYGINFKSSSRNVLEKVPAFRLQNQIFTSFFNDDMFKKLKYVPGIIKQEEILKNKIVFFVREPKIETLFQIADQSVTMPPKSTWIQPKPCSHMVIRLIA